MMSRNNTENQKKNASRPSLLENNKVVSIVAIFVAIICWGVVSLYETPETERVIQNVKVQITGTDELYEQYGLSVFDAEEYTVDVTVKGLSYLVNSSTFTADNISVTASCASVASSGTYPLTLSHSINGSGGIEVVKLSKNTINVYFDKEVEKEFPLTEDIQELEGYSLAAGFIRENPVLSAETVTYSGPSRDINKVTAVKAHIELNQELKATERFDAEIIPESESGTLDVSKLTLKTEGPIYITIPLNHTGTYETVVSFTGVPQAYRSTGLDYTVTPAAVDVTVAASTGSYDIESNQINVGSIDFSQILGEQINYIKLKSKDVGEEEQTFTVVVDASAYYVRWLSVPVDAEAADLPANIKVDTAAVPSVRLVGPEASLYEADDSTAYAIPVIDDPASMAPGTYTVPAKIVLRTLTDSWAYGSYTVQITVS